MARRLLLIAPLLVFTACAGKQRPDPIPDVPESRAILSVIEQYRAAMESQDIDGILSLASPDYHEDMGTPEHEDDVAFSDLKAKLDQDFGQVKVLRLDVDVMKIDFDEKHEVAQVDLRYDLRYQLSLPSGEKWHNNLDVSRMILRREGDGWRVVTGL